MADFYPGKYANFIWLLPGLCERVGDCQKKEAIALAKIVEDTGFPVKKIHWLHKMNEEYTGRYVSLMREKQIPLAEVYGRVGRVFYDQIEIMVHPLFGKMVQLGHIDDW